MKAKTRETAKQGFGQQREGRKVTYWSAFELCQDDQDAFDALVEAGFDLSKIEPGPVSERASRILAVLQRLEDYPVDDVVDDEDSPAAMTSESLIQRTLAKIDEHEGPISIEQARASGAYAAIGVADPERNGLSMMPSGMGWREMATIAAVLVLLVSLVWPILESTRSMSVALACRTNMMGVGAGLGQYATENDGRLPVAPGMNVNVNWLEGRQGSANLLHLARLGYVSPVTLACPGNGHADTSSRLLEMENYATREAASFTFQNLNGRVQPHWDLRPAIAILSDSSPVIRAMLDDDIVDREAISPCHGPDGQNVLFSDGSALWLTSSELGCDNIWLPGSCKSPYPILSGDETPIDDHDSMLIH
jgi:hypothetical protein